MRANLTRIGNSRGIRVPKPLLDPVGLGNTVQLRAGKGRLVIQPDHAPRQGWEQDFAAMAERGDGRALPGEITNAFDRNEWTW
jgi:antitoxin MazE